MNIVNEVLHDMDLLTSPSRLECNPEGDPSRTQQHSKDDCDINRILAKFHKTGELNHLADHEPTYGDFSDAADYKTSCDRVLAAQADFAALSSRIRARMGHDPAALIAFMEDEANHEEARDLGLLPPLPRSEEGRGEQGGAASKESSPSPPKPPETAPEQS